MAPSANLSIAGAAFALSSRYPVDCEGLPPSYDPFRGITSRLPEALDVGVRVELGEAPFPSSLTTIFDTGGSWVMSTDGDCYYLTLNPRRLSGQQLWTAQVTRDFREATVFCGEQMVRRTEHGITIIDPVTYPLDQILLMYVLARHEGALLHAAGAKINGRGFIFPGRSGAGKSTLAGHLAGREGVELLSDDRIALRKVDGTFLAYGTPWAGDQGAALNDKASLCGIYFLRHGNANRIVELKQSDAFERLLPIASIPWYDPGVMSEALSFCEDLIAQVPAFELQFSPGPGVAQLVTEFG